MPNFRFPFRFIITGLSSAVAFQCSLCALTVVVFPPQLQCYFCKLFNLHCDTGYLICLDVWKQGAWTPACQCENCAATCLILVAAFCLTAQKEEKQQQACMVFLQSWPMSVVLWNLTARFTHWSWCLPFSSFFFLLLHCSRDKWGLPMHYYNIAPPEELKWFVWPTLFVQPAALCKCNHLKAPWCCVETRF